MILARPPPTSKPHVFRDGNRWDVLVNRPILAWELAKFEEWAWHRTVRVSVTRKAPIQGAEIIGVV